MIHVEFIWIKGSSVGCSSAILYRLTHKCSSGRAGGVIVGVSSVLNVPSNVSMVDREEQYLSSYVYISWRVNCTKSWEINTITGTEQKIYKGKELILHHSFSVLDTDSFICSVASSSFPTQISSPDGWCGGSWRHCFALEISGWKLHAPQEKQQAAHHMCCLCFFNVPSFLYGRVNQTLKPPNQPVFRWVIRLFFSTGQLQCSNSHLQQDKDAVRGTGWQTCKKKK